MQHTKRRAIAYIAGRIISNVESGAVYDYLENRHFNFSGDVSSNINVYDYSRANYLTGDSSSIYDYYTGQYINLDISKSSFSGYDYETGSYFNGTVNDRSVSFYDYQSGKHYNFSI
jgi:hypothetical protein